MKKKNKNQEINFGVHHAIVQDQDNTKPLYVQNLSTYTKLLSKTIFISTLVHTCTQGITRV